MREIYPQVYYTQFLQHSLVATPLQAAMMMLAIGNGTLSFKEGESYQFDMPDLCVIIYLKFGDYGKEAAPLAAQIIKRWREIEKRHKIKE